MDRSSRNKPNKSKNNGAKAAKKTMKKSPKKGLAYLSVEETEEGEIMEEDNEDDSDDESKFVPESIIYGEDDREWLSQLPTFEKTVSYRYFFRLVLVPLPEVLQMSECTIAAPLPPPISTQFEN